MSIPEAHEKWTLAEETIAPGASFSPDHGPLLFDPDFIVSREPHLISQAELNDLIRIRDLKLNKQLAEILSSRLQEWNLLQPGTKMPYRKRELNLSSFFTENEQLVFPLLISWLNLEKNIILKSNPS